MRLLLAAAAVLVAAGCVAPEVGTATLPDLPLPAEAAFLRVSAVLDEAGGHGEPSFGAAPDGTLFANGDGGSGGAVYRSSDGGATWEVVGTPVDPVPNFDPDLAVDVDGNVWFSALYVACTATAVSQDLGATWSSNPAACNTLVADRQYVVPTKGGEAYLYSHQVPTFYQMAAKTTDFGRTWVPTGPVELPDHFLLANGGSGWGGGGFYNAATGSVFLTFTWSHGLAAAATGGPAWSAGYAVTRDGLTWETGTVPSMGGAQLGLGLVVGAADEAGNVYLAWGEDHDGDVGVYLASSEDDGRSWSAPKRVDAGAGSNVFPAIAAGGDGKVAVASYQSDAAANPSDVDGEWNVTLAWTHDALAETPTWSYGNLSKQAVKTGPICISGTTCTGDREFADYFQVHRLPDGRVGAIFNSLTEVEGKLVEVFAATEEALL